MSKESRLNQIFIDKALNFKRGETLDITAAGGIPKPTTPIVRVQGDSGPVAITANPQIAAPDFNYPLLIVEGASSTNTVTLNNGNGLHLHTQAVINEHDILFLFYDGNDYVEIARNFNFIKPSFSFDSPAGTSGVFYSNGYYDFFTGNSDFVVAQNFGTANVAYAAHLLLVSSAQPGSDSIIRVSGTSITDAGVRTPADTEDVTFLDTEGANTYHETDKKWIGQVTITFISGDNTVNYNYGWSKYWDNNNNDFIVKGIEVTGRAGANDSAPNFELIHHKATGWTYNAGAEPTPPTAVADMNTDHGTESELVNGEPFAWKRDNLNEAVKGGNGEGIIFKYTTTANRAVDQGDVIYTIRPE
jgi:hypothetical protein